MRPRYGWLAIVAALSLCALTARTAGQNSEDPNRPPCTTIQCRTIKRFVKTHYCGASPFGDGPDDGCQIKTIEKPQKEVRVLADYRCAWDEVKRTAKCEQTGEPSSLVRGILMTRLHGLGLPASAKGETWFTVWKPSRASWSLAAAYYSHQSGDDLWLCEVIAAIDQNSRAIVIDKLPFQKTDIDTPDVTQWAPMDITDVAGAGHDDIVLEGDAYENHWLQVVRVQDGVAYTIFSGLGYYL